MHPGILKAKIEYVRGIPYRGNFQAVITKEIVPDAKIVPGIFVLEIESKEYGSTWFEAGFFLGVHRDKIKKLMVHSSQTL